MHQLARLSIGRLRVPVDDPSTDFVRPLEIVQAATGGAPGLVWHNNPDSTPNPRSFATLTVWRSRQDLRSFLSGPVHRAFTLRRNDWFESHDGPHEVLWWTCSLHTPTLAEAIQRLQTLRMNGPSMRAFTINDTIPPN